MRNSDHGTTYMRVGGDDGEETPKVGGFEVSAAWRASTLPACNPYTSAPDWGWGSGFRVQGFGFMDWDFRMRVGKWGVGGWVFRVRFYDSGFQGSGFRPMH
jgi:hypothetical protein